MPKLKKLFRRIKAERNESHSIEKLLETTEMLQKKSDFLEKRIEDEGKFAVKNGTKNKKGKKRFFSNLLRLELKI